MAPDFKPRYGRVTLTSILGQGVLRELACAESGEITVENGPETPCHLGLYHVILYENKSRVHEETVMAGMTADGAALTEDQCRELLTLPVVSFSEEGRSNPQWLKSEGKRHALDNLVPVQAILDERAKTLSPAVADEVERRKLETARKKAAIAREIDALEKRVAALRQEHDAVSGDRLRRLALEKQINRLHRESMSKQENQFFEAMRLDLELEQHIKELTGKEKLTAKVVREFLVKIVGQNA